MKWERVWRDCELDPYFGGVMLLVIGQTERWAQTYVKRAYFSCELLAELSPEMCAEILEREYVEMEEFFRDEVPV